jgi:hypothetical protein
VLPISRGGFDDNTSLHVQSQPAPLLMKDQLILEFNVRTVFRAQMETLVQRLDDGLWCCPNDQQGSVKGSAGPATARPALNLVREDAQGMIGILKLERTKMTKLENKTEAIDTAADAAADEKNNAINKFMKAEFTVIDACKKEDELRTAGKREGDSEYDKVASAMEAAFDARDDALDDLIAAEFAFRAATKAWQKHHNALDKTKAGGVTERMQ